MKHKRILIAAILLLAILTVGAVSASEDVDVLAQDSDVLAQDADGLAQESDAIVSQDNAIDDKISSLDDEFEGNFTFTMDPISTTSGQTTFATLNLPEATEGIVLLTTENESLLFEKDLSANDFYQSSEGYSSNILVRDIDFDNLGQGKQFLNFRFYDSDHNQVIHEYYQVDYNKGSNMLVLSPAIYLEIYDGLITDDNDDPIIVVYADLMQLQRYALTIFDEDYTWGYYPTDLTHLTLANGGLYTKNHFEGWFYYGVNAARLKYNGLDSSLDGMTLDISVRKLQNGMYQEWMARENRTLTFEYDGFYLDDGVVYPTLIIEVYGDEYMPIDYNNGIAFALIVSGDERTGKWLPVDKIIPVTLRVSSDDGEIEFLNVNLGSLDYTATGSMGIIEHMFTLSDVNNFSGLSDGDIIRFALKVPPFPESYLYYIINFEQDGIMLTEDNGEDTGEAYFNVNDKVFNDVSYEQVFGIDVSQDQLDNELGSGIVEVTSDDGQTIFRSDELYELYFVDDDNGRLVRWFTLGELSYFSDLDNGDIVYFTLWQYDGAVEPWIQKRYRVTFDDTYIYLEEYEDEGGESVIIYDNANMADNDVVVIINPSYLPQYLGDDWMVNITVDVWGHMITTVWNSTLLQENDDGCFEFTVTDLELDRIMRDIDSDADCNIYVNIYDGEYELVSYDGQAILYTNPYIYSDDIVLDEDGTVIIFTDFSRFEDIGCNDAFTVTSTSDNGSVTKTFRISQMDQYWISDGDDEGCYALSAEDLGISQNGHYDVSIEFKRGTQSIYYNGSFEVVPFGIYVQYGEDKSEDLVDDVSLDVFGIGLPGDTTNRARVYVNGTKVLDKSLSEIGVSHNPVGKEMFIIRLNDLQITQSGKYNVKLEVLDKNNRLLRNVSTTFWVEVIENLIGFSDILYIDGDYVNSMLGEPVAQASDIVLFLNGQRAGVGRFVEILGFDFELDDAFTDDYGNILPGYYEAQAIWVSPNGNKTIGEGSFNVLNDSGTVDVTYYAEPNPDNPDEDRLWISISAPYPGEDSGLYNLAVYVDPESTNEFPLMEWEGDMLEDVWNGGCEIGLDSVGPGVHRVVVIYFANPNELSFDYMDYYSGIGEIVTGNPTQLINTTLTASKVTTTYNSGKMLTATLKDEEGNRISGAEVRIAVGSISEILTTNANGQASLALNGLTPGNYVATITFDGNDNYRKSNTTVSVVVAKADTVISAQDVTVAYKNTTGELLASVASVNGKALKVNLNVNFNGESYTVKADSKGQISIPIGVLAPGTYAATISYAGNVNYNPSSTTANVVVTKADTVISAPDVTVAYKNTTELVATLTNAYGNALGVNVNVNFNGESYTVKANSKGQISIPIGVLAPGTYAATFSYAGNGNYNPSSATANVVVTKADTVISAPKASVAFKDPSGKLVATLTNAYGNGLGVNLNVNLNGQSYTLKANSKGQITIPTEDLPVGTHTATISYGGNANYNPSTATAKIVVNKANTQILASNVSVAYKDTTEQLIATLTNAYDNTISGNIIVNINGKDYAVTAYSNGKIRVSTATLSPGSYIATISFKGSSNYKASSATANVVVTKADTVISAPNVSVGFKDPNGELVATITNAYGKPLSVNVNMNLNGQDYTVKADSNGKISLSVSGLSPGSYVATISYAGNVNYKASSTTANVVVTKANTVISVSDVSVGFKDPNGELVATITNAYGKALSVNVNVNLNGQDYTVKADSNGKVSLSVSGLSPGSYVATISYKGNVNYKASSATANVVVNKANTAISAPDVAVAYQNKNGKLVATLTNEFGKPLSVNVVVNFNGETYTAKTDSKGQITISTAGLAPGSYSATITYNGNVNYNPSTATANIVVDKADTVITAQDVTVKAGDANGKLVAAISNAYGRALSVNVNVNINGQDYTVKADSNGQISLSTAGLASGSYVATISYKGNGNYNPSSTTANVIVKP